MNNPRTLSISARPKLKLDRVKLIDELGKLDLELAKAKLKKERRDEIVTLLQLEARAYPVTAGIQWDGLKFAVALGPKGNQRTVPDKRKVQSVIGDELFLAIVTVPLGKLEDVYPNAEALGLIKKEQTGERTVKTFLRGAA